MPHTRESKAVPRHSEYLTTMQSVNIRGHTVPVPAPVPRDPHTAPVTRQSVGRKHISVLEHKTFVLKHTTVADAAI